VTNLVPVAINERPAMAHLTKELRDIMSTSTATFGHHAADLTTRDASVDAVNRKSFFQRLVEARTRQARLYSNSVLARMTDAQLGELGFAAEDIRDIRKGGSRPVAFWL